MSQSDRPRLVQVVRPSTRRSAASPATPSWLQQYRLPIAVGAVFVLALVAYTAHTSGIAPRTNADHTALRMREEDATRPTRTGGKDGRSGGAHATEDAARPTALAERDDDDEGPDDADDTSPGSGPAASTSPVPIVSATETPSPTLLPASASITPGPPGPTVTQQIMEVTGGRPLLEPGKPGTCYFHGQEPHFQDREIFKRLGGVIDEGACRSRPLQNTPFPSQATSCPCVAPTDPAAFGQAFLEIGSLDGTFLSNLLFFESQLNWRGLCVEGSPVNYAHLVRNRPLCTTVNAIISKDTKTAGEGVGKATFYTFSGSWLNSMSCMEGHSVCESRASAEKYARESGSQLVVDQVPMHTLAHLFAKAGISKMGWLMVDVEGAEDLIMETIDFNALCARWVTYEGEHQRSNDMLVAAGYEYTTSFGPDRVFIPKSGPCVPPAPSPSASPSPPPPVPSVTQQIATVTGGKPQLEPGKPGICYFHGQEPHYQDREIFKRLGGTIDAANCRSKPLEGTPFPSQATVCPCVAPADPAAFGQSFLEIGSLDGTFLSNLLFFESQLNWRGLCVEGSPVNYEHLVKNRPLCTTVNAIISKDAKTAGEGVGKATFYTFSGSWLNSMSCMAGHSYCVDRTTAENYARETGSKLIVNEVPMHTLAHLFSKAGISKMGWLMVDVEGAEDLIMETIDFTAMCAHYVTYEGEHQRSNDMLVAAGYEYITSFGPDRVFVPKSGPCVPAPTPSPSPPPAPPTVTKQIVDATGGKPLLEPGKPGICYFHGQEPHFQDREIFKRLGGTIDAAHCHAKPLEGTPFPSQAAICPCVAPPDPAAFGQSFLEIGSLDGTFLSNLLFFESQLNWRGLCVEGSPVNYAHLVRNRPLCNTVNAIISGDARTQGEGVGKATFYTFSGSWLNSMSCMEGHSVCESRASAEKYARESGSQLVVDQVPMHTLAHLFDRAGIKKMGWLMVDVEGAEDLVISTIDFNAVCARWVTYEGEHQRSYDLLAAAGYEYKASFGPDRVFMPKSGPCVA